MTVKEVMERLKCLPENAHVYVADKTGWHEVSTVTGNFCSPKHVGEYIEFSNCAWDPDAERTEVVVEISAF